MLSRFACGAGGQPPPRVVRARLGRGRARLGRSLGTYRAPLEPRHVASEADRSNREATARKHERMTGSVAHMPARGGIALRLAARSNIAKSRTRHGREVAAWFYVRRRKPCQRQDLLLREGGKKRMAVGVACERMPAHSYAMQLGLRTVPLRSAHNPNTIRKPRSIPIRPAAQQPSRRRCTRTPLG